MMTLCPGCPHLKQLGEEEFTCSKARCVVPLEKKRKQKASAPTPAPTQGAFAMTVQHAGWKKRAGDKVTIDNPGSPWHGQSFPQQSDEVVVVNQTVFLYLAGLPGDLAPLRVCR